MADPVEGPLQDLRVLGAAQVQVVSEGTVGVEERNEAFAQIVGAYEPLIGAMAGGVVR